MMPNSTLDAGLPRALGANAPIYRAALVARAPCDEPAPDRRGRAAGRGSRTASRARAGDSIRETLVSRRDSRRRLGACRKPTRRVHHRCDTRPHRGREHRSE
jgi:hypothetical protein